MAIEHEKAVYSWLKDVCGDEVTNPSCLSIKPLQHERTKQAAESLKNFTEKAVNQLKSENAIKAAAADAAAAAAAANAQPAAEVAETPVEKPKNKANKKSRQRAKKKMAEIETPPSDDDFILVSRKKHGNR